MQKLLAFLFFTLLVCSNYASKANQKPKIEIKLLQHQLVLKHGNLIYKTYPIGVAKDKNYLNALGDFAINMKVKDPGWKNPFTGARIPPGPNNPIGPRWMEFYTVGNKSFGIHGTNQPASIGTFASHGCIRMLNNDVIELFDLVPKGTEVSVLYEPFLIKQHGNDITVTIFHDPYGLKPLTKKAIVSTLRQNFPDIIINTKTIELLLDNKMLKQERVVGHLEREEA